MPGPAPTLPVCRSVHGVAAAGVAAVKVTSWFPVSRARGQHWDVFSCLWAQGHWFKTSHCSRRLRWPKGKAAKENIIPFPGGDGTGVWHLLA